MLKRAAPPPAGIRTEFHICEKTNVLRNRQDAGAMAKGAHVSNLHSSAQTTADFFRANAFRRTFPRNRSQFPG